MVVLYCIGVDVGTTNWKVVAYDMNGAAVAEFRCPSRTHHDEAGAFYLPEEMWDVISGGISEVVAKLPDPSLVSGIAVASIGESLVLLDGAGRPVGPTLAWFDARTGPQAERWHAKLGGTYELFQITGMAPQRIASVNKLLWLRENEPDAFGAAKQWLCVADYISYRLCGEAVMDYSVASRTGLFDVRRRVWSERLVEAAGFEPSFMPRLAASGTLLGGISRDAARRTGLLPGTPVSVGGHDHICGALAAGVTEEGAVLDSTGTAEAVLMVVREPTPDLALHDAGFTLGCHTVPGRHYLLGTLATAGAVVEWLRDSFGFPPEDGYAAVMAAVESVAPGAGGLFFLPYLRGSMTVNVDPGARAVYAGLTTSHTRAHLSRAALEGVCFELRAMIERMSALTGIACHGLTAIGGAVRNRTWMQMKADVTGQPVAVPPLEEAVSLGAAILAARGAGVPCDPAAARARSGIGAGSASYVRDEAAHTAYNRYFPLYQDLYPANRGLMSAINAEVWEVDQCPLSTCRRF